jgi:glycosyltransferase involved in cell wall biosynthesis
MREGQNPAKFITTVAHPRRITVAVLSYIPFLSGFYRESLDVLKVCLASIRTTTKLEFDLLVFDNGSEPETVEYLQEGQRQGVVQYLFLSGKNLGKGGAWNIIFDSAPGEILAYTDSDALFYNGWLEASLELLERFPNVGMVTSRPFRTPPKFYSSTVSWAEKSREIEIERGQFIPWETFRDFDLSLGQDETAIRTRYEQTEDVLLKYQGLTAIAGASHWQFVARTATLASFLPFRMDRPMGQVRDLDQRMNEAGLLRLMTTEPLVMNLSNSLEGIPVHGRVTKSPASSIHLGKRILNLPPIRWFLLLIYNRIFRWYYSR